MLIRLRGRTGDLRLHCYSPALKRWGAILDLPCPSGILWFCHSVKIQMKLEYLWGQLANVDQILYEASLGWGKGCIRFWDRLDQNSGFHGNRKCPLTYNGENNVSTFSQLFLIRFFLYLPVTRTCINSRTELVRSFFIGSSSNLLVTRTAIQSQTNSNSGQIGSVTSELHALVGKLNFQ